MPRMRILNAAEQARFEHPPVFDSAERKRYFDFSQSIMYAAQDLRSPANRMGFLLAYGYFRATRRFFSPDQYQERDIAFVARTVGVSPNAFSSEAYKDRTRLNHQKRILDLQGFRPFDAQAEAELITEIAAMVRAHLKPRLIFGRCTDFLIEKRIEVPGVRRLTNLIRAALGVHKSSLIRLVDTNLSLELRTMLDDLFVQEARQRPTGRKPRRSPRGAVLAGLDVRFQTRLAQRLVGLGQVLHEPTEAPMLGDQRLRPLDRVRGNAPVGRLAAGTAGDDPAGTVARGARGRAVASRLAAFAVEGAQGTGPEVADLRELALKVVPPPAELFGRGVGGHGMASPSE